MQFVDRDEIFMRRVITQRSAMREKNQAWAAFHPIDSVFIASCSARESPGHAND
jgi:hypothetical protein